MTIAFAVAGAAVLAVASGPAWAQVVPAQSVPAQSGPAPGYIWPVHGTVVDPFRPPEGPYGPGNRGLEFATQPGSAFWAAADGVVSFAGPVGGRLHVTVSHPDGLRVSYSGVASIGVRRGERVRQRQELGATGDRLHIGVRRGETYLNPALIFGSRRSPSGQPSLGRPHLVPSSPAVYRLQLRWLHSGVGNAVL
ncbi:MAG: M23 family metallopeptidase [Acidimicrobiales bacterium]|nr:M23 family metallopeptidase [Acidimicrobiales bacterium]MYB81453.1 M23 family metallopeptidase [Acidimicrobiales bacterium]MYI11684.1 M23 family metallopeptidase [Acidimicrobiales bacterium]